MQRVVSAFSAGLLFGLGLAIAQMTNPDKVLGFLDVAGNWDPSLLLVLGGAVAVTALTFRFILRRPAPLLDRDEMLEKANRYGISLTGIPVASD